MFTLFAREGGAGGRPALWPLVFFVIRRHRLEVFGLEDLPALQALDVVDAVTSGDHRDLGMLAGGGFHTERLSPLIVFAGQMLSSPVFAAVTPYCKYYAKTRLATQHMVVGFGRALERIDLVH
jgi:hypothetical protein